MIAERPEPLECLYPYPAWWMPERHLHVRAQHSQEKCSEAADQAKTFGVPDSLACGPPGRSVRHIIPLGAAQADGLGTLHLSSCSVIFSYCIVHPSRRRVASETWRLHKHTKTFDPLSRGFSMVSPLHSWEALMGKAAQLGRYFKHAPDRKTPCTNCTLVRRSCIIQVQLTLIIV